MLETQRLFIDGRPVDASTGETFATINPATGREALDTGKPIQEAEAVDVASGADCIEYFAGLAPSLAGLGDVACPYR